MTERNTGKAALAAAFLFVTCTWATTIQASVSVSPVRLDLDAAHSRDVITIGNGGTEAKSYEAGVSAWSQSADSGDTYTPSDDVLVVPPIFTLQPGEQQTVRVGLMRNPDVDTELAYRVFFTELPPPQPEAPQQSGVTMRLRLGVPLFVAPVKGVSPGLKVTGSERNGDVLFMHFLNTGNVHVKVNEVQYEAPGLAEKTSTAAVFYILPGQTGTLPISLPHGNAVGTVTLITDTAGSLEYDLQASP